MTKNKKGIKTMNKETFEKIWALKPDHKSKVYVYNKEKDTHEEKQIYRSYRSYLRVPPFDTRIKKSYMYDGVEPSVPNELIPYLIHATKEDERYNQMVVNWYEPEDYIEKHSDCDAFMVNDYLIGVMSIDEPGTSPRQMVFTCRDQETGVTPLTLAGWVEIPDYMNRDFRHEVGAGEGRRISITFRMLREGVGYE
jgi:hypothetical protein